jgi:hypothetical protein
VTGLPLQIALFTTFGAVGIGLVSMFGVSFGGGWRLTAIGLAPFLGMLGCGVALVCFAATGLRMHPIIPIGLAAVISAVGAMGRRRLESPRPACLRLELSSRSDSFACSR